ncbi:hypothetical protein SBDP1_310001 [Syntrophobacter sp. SbD1]|nr:hypothetical protein SBDP1_310001 [Syntrophobacter sp. SbD1]
MAGGNTLVTLPDSNALRVMTETAKFAHYVLPAANQFEFAGLAYNYNVCHCMPLPPLSTTDTRSVS